MFWMVLSIALPPSLAALFATSAALFILSAWVSVFEAVFPTPSLSLKAPAICCAWVLAPSAICSTDVDVCVTIRFISSPAPSIFCDTEPMLIPASLSSVTMPRKLSMVPLIPSTIEANSPDAATSISLVRVPSPTSAMTSLISPIMVPSLSTIPLMVLFSSCISPFASTVIF